MSRKTQLEAAYRAVVDEIASICNANRLQRPTLVAVSKYHAAEDIRTLYDLGQRHFGENYVQELAQKAKELPGDIHWHMIGNLQSNKAKIVRDIPNLDVLETLDSVSKASKVNNQREGLSPLKVYIQVNTSGESQKSGVSGSENVIELADHVKKNCPNLVLEGLMTIGSLESSKSAADNKDFSLLRQIRNDTEKALNLPGDSLRLSMGMSSDYLEAIKQGSTNVRVGSSIFGPRPLKQDIQ